ncbi:MAG: hypothetical protein WC897_00585 [Candidatus Gracilibacteria bacterium]
MSSPEHKNLFDHAWDRAEETSGVDWDKLGFGNFGGERFFFLHLPVAIASEVLGVLGGGAKACSSGILSATKDFALGPKTDDGVRTGWRSSTPQNCPPEARGAYAIQGLLCEALPRNLVAGLQSLFGTQAKKTSIEQK